MSGSSNWTIRVGEFQIPDAPYWYHTFIDLVDSNGNVVAEMDGMPAQSVQSPVQNLSNPMAYPGVFGVIGGLIGIESAYKLYAYQVLPTTNGLPSGQTYASVDGVSDDRGGWLNSDSPISGKSA